MSKKRKSKLEAIKADEVSAASFKHFKVPVGWRVIEPAPARRITDVSKLKLRSFHKKGEGPINGGVMRERAKEMGCDFGLEDLEYFLEHQDEIPEKFWNSSIYLVFPGTVLEDSDGRRYVAYLYWYGGRWYLYFDWLVYDWDSSGRFPFPPKS